jgi:hypothetical protein
MWPWIAYTICACRISKFCRVNEQQKPNLIVFFCAFHFMLWKLEGQVAYLEGYSSSFGNNTTHFLTLTTQHVCERD